jgi:NDP-sugar pyrophosphorylase family protein
MPHYANGEEARVGDTVKGKGYNVKHEIVGKVVNVRKGESCTLSVAYVGEKSKVMVPLGEDVNNSFQGGVTATVDIEYGDTKGFDLVTR